MALQVAEDFTHRSLQERNKGSYIKTKMTNIFKKKREKHQNENKKWDGGIVIEGKSGQTLHRRRSGWKALKEDTDTERRGAEWGAGRRETVRKRRTRAGRDNNRGCRTRAQTGREGQWAQLWFLLESDRFTWWHICLSDSHRLSNLPLKDLHGAADDTEGTDSNTSTQTDYMMFQASFRLLLNIK